jgi:hypothetical protein
MRYYAVIDSAQRPHFHERLDRLGAAYCSLFDEQAEESLTEIAPLLVACDRADPTSRLALELERLGAAKPAVSYIGSALPMQDLACHFRAFHLVKVPAEQGERDMLLRWYDTRILPVWLQLLTAEQKAVFTAGIEEWHYFDRFGDLQPLPLPGPLAAGLAALPPLRLDDAQYAEFLEACEPDVAIAQLRRIIPDEMRRVEHRVLYPFVQQQMEQARAHGLGSIDDHVHYLLLALYTNGRFRSHAYVAERLAAPASMHEQAFAAWAATVHADVWELGRPLWESAPIAPSNDIADHLRSAL